MGRRMTSITIDEILLAKVKQVCFQQKKTMSSYFEALIEAHLGPGPQLKPRKAAEISAVLENSESKKERAKTP